MIGVLTAYVGGPFDGRRDRLPPAANGRPALRIDVENINVAELVDHAGDETRIAGARVGTYFNTETAAPDGALVYRWREETP